MTAFTFRGRVTRVLQALLPSALRRFLLHRRLHQRHGLKSFGTDFGYAIFDDNTFGVGCRVGGPVYVIESDIGNYSYVEVGCRISRATIGKYCSIAPYTIIGMAEHPAKRCVSSHPLFYRRIEELGYVYVDSDQHQELVPTTLGNDVWVGAGVCIRCGLHIGTGAVVGAGAVVTKDVPPYAIVAGVPAKVIGYRFEREVIDRLLASKWWDRDEEWIRHHAPIFCRPEVFLKALEAEAVGRSPGTEYE